jgi:hypothetical protein
MASVQLGQLLGDRHGLAVALESLLGADPLGGQPLGLACLVEEGPTLGQACLGLAPPLTGAGEGVAIPLQLGEGELALLDGQPGLLDRILGDLEAPGFLAPFVFRSKIAFSSLCRARDVPRSAPLIDAWSRSRRVASSRSRSASSWWRIDAVERKNASLGMPVISAIA